MKRNTYTYRLISHARYIGGQVEWIRVWVKKSVKNYRYNYYPIILTYSNRFGLFIEKRFKDMAHLLAYLKRKTPDIATGGLLS